MLTELQKEVALDLLNGQQKTDIAVLRGVGRTTIYLWLKEPEFLDYMSQEAESLTRENKSKLTGLSKRAIDKLEKMLNSKSEHVVMKAINSILDRAGYAAELSIKQELNRPAAEKTELTPEEVREQLSQLRQRRLSIVRDGTEQ